MHSLSVRPLKPMDGKRGADIVHRQSDRPIVLMKSRNGDGEKGAAAMRRDARDTFAGHRTGKRMRTKLASLTLRAGENPRCKFISLAHLLDEDFLKGCFRELKRDKAAGVDGVSVKEYEAGLEENIRDLVKRLKAKKYRPQPVRRAYIPKGNGKLRGLGVPTVEDKVVQMGVKKILEAIYEADFLDVSFGFRPKRSCHDALEVLGKAVMTRPVNWVVDMDIEKFFDTIDHRWLMKCLMERIKDRSLLQLVVRFLKAGVMEEGRLVRTDMGTPQGGVLSPLLANIYLHYVLDWWFEKAFKKRLKGFAQLVRYADDFVVCFQSENEAKAFERALRLRLGRFGLKISESKSRVLAFGRYARQNAQRYGGRVETFDFLGFTHYCARTRRGRFKVGRKTSGSKFRQKAKAMNEWLRWVRNRAKLPEWWKVLGVKLTGHYRYYGISGNYEGVKKFYRLAVKLAHKWIERRSQKRSYNCEQFSRFMEYNPLPVPRIYHRTYAPSSH